VNAAGGDPGAIHSGLPTRSLSATFVFYLTHYNTRQRAASQSMNYGE